MSAAPLDFPPSALPSHEILHHNTPITPLPLSSSLSSHDESSLALVEPEIVDDKGVTSVTASLSSTLPPVISTENDPPVPIIHPYFQIYKSSYVASFQSEMNYVPELERVISELYDNGSLINFDTKKNELTITLPPLSTHRIPLSIQQNKQISKKHTYWKGLQYVHEIFQHWKNYFPFIEESTIIICRNCFHELGPVSDFCFCIKSQNDISFILNPNKIREYESNIFNIGEREHVSNTSLSSLKYPINCRNCSSKLGSDNSHGPRNSRFFEFGHDKISFSGSESYKSKWLKLLQLPEFGLVSRFNLESENSIESSSLQITTTQAKLIIPARKEDFGWEDIIVSPLVPKPEQLRAYCRTLLWNSIIMLPTGAGKTLIASLTIARFVKLNPHLIAVMVVDRVPLVHQQANSLRRDVMINVYPLCGETSSSSVKARILGGQYECIVSTAGAFVELFKLPGMTISKFSVIVFDECHHAVKQHKYCEILKKVEASVFRPRLVGLSASPVTGKDYHRIQLSLEEIKKNFLNALIYKPVSTRSEPEYTWHTVDYSGKQKEKIMEMQRELEEICLRIMPKEVDSEWITCVPISSIISKAFELDPPPSKADVERLRFLNVAFEVNKLLGPAYIQRSDENFHPSDSSHLSPYLLKMEDIIRELPPTSRTIVFVDQKVSAKLIQRRLQFSFPHLNPAYIVGNNGWDGMNWKVQGEILKKFNRKTDNEDSIKIIVSTSVLEEGLDVQSCETVFRFGGRSSLIQFVQSRGRARTGRMHIILTESERVHVDRIIQEEQLLNHAFSRESQQSDKILSQTYGDLDLLCPDGDDRIFSESNCHLDDLLEGAQSVALKFFANCPHEKSVEPSIINELKSLGFISSVPHFSLEFGQSRIDSATPVLFEDTDCVIHLNVATDTPLSDFFLYLISMWRFSARLPGNTYMDIYLPLPSALLSEIPSRGPVEFVSDIRKVDVGFLLKRRTYEVVHRLGSGGLQYTSLSITNNLWELDAIFGHSKNCRLIIQSPISQLSQFALISADQKEKTLTLFMFTKATPTVLLEDGEILTRVACFHPLNENASSSDCPLSIAREELKKISQTTMFSITYPLSKWTDLLALLTRNGLKFSVYFTSLSPIGDLGIAQAEREGEIAQVSSELWSRYCFDSLTNIERKVFFSIYSLSSVLREYLCNPIFLHKIKVDALQTLEYGIRSRMSLENEVNLEGLFELLERLPAYFLNKSLWINHYSIFCDLKEKVINSFPVNDVTADLTGYKSVCRVLITPSQVIFRPAYLIKTNRLLRKHHFEDFAYVSFVDENTTPIFNEKIFYLRYIDYLVHGFGIGAAHFSFLLCSASQQREQRAIFVCGNNDKAQSIRDSIASFAHFKGDIAKYMSRLGLYCTADTYVDANANTIEVEPDIYTHENNSDTGKILTDGAGKISLKFFNSVKSSLPNLPSFNRPFCAFQFRLGGSKGVLYQQDGLEPDILFRESNVKFHSSDNDLCVVQPALSHPVKINREMLNLLFSFTDEGEHGGKWDPFPYVRQLQRAELALLGDIFVDQQKAIGQLSERLGNNHVEDLCVCSFNLYEDPFFKKMLSVIYNYRCRMLRSKVHITLKDGAYLMGICDPTGLLKDGEIFYQIKDSSQSNHIGLGRHLIFRNPCLDPGDLRVVNAVEVDELKAYFNVVIFPASRKCFRSLPAECSGGDLDGDMFSIIADPNLIPPGQFHSVDYDLIAKQAKQSITSTSSKSVSENFHLQIARFLIRAMTNSNLGRIARLHLALCDQVSHQAANPLAREVAQTQSLAVDFVKTGVPPTIPKQAKSIVKKNGYPSFMESASKREYVSSKPLGILYDDVISGVCEYDMDRRLENSEKTYIEGLIEPNLLFILPKKEKYEVEARAIYFEYCESIRGILSRFSIMSDAELMLSLPEKLSPELMRDQGAVEQSLSEIWSCIQRKYRNIFRSIHLESELLEKASAWHCVAYSTEPYFLSFSWIISDYLLSIAKLNSGLHVTQNDKVFQDIGDSVLAFWIDHRDELNENVNSKVACFDELVKLTISCSKYKLHLYGSVQLLLCDAESDLDIYVESIDVHGYDKMHQLGILRGFAPDVESQVSSLNLVDASVPIIRGYIEDTTGDRQNLDFSACSDGYYKALYLRYFYSRCRYHLIVMFALMNWARCCRLIPVDHDDGGELDCLRKGEFHAFVLHILDDRNQEPMFTEEFIPTSSTELIFSTDFSPTDLGKTIIKFFQLGKDVSYDSDFSYTWPVSGAPVHIIKSAMVQRISIACSRAYHCLVRSRDWSFLQQNAIACDTSETMTKIRLPANSILARTLMSATRWHVMNLEYYSRASVNISTTGEYCEIEGRGTRNQIMKLRTIFRQFYQKSKRYLSGSMRSNCAAYFMANSTLFYCREAYSVLSIIQLEPYLGPKHDQHACAELSRVLLLGSKSREDLSSWREDYKKILKEKFLHQLEAMVLGHKEVVTVTIHFGTFYTVNANDCFRSADVTLRDLTQAHVRGRTQKERESFDDTILPNIYSHVPQPSSPDGPPTLSSEKSISSTTSSNNGLLNKRISRLATSFWNSITNWRAPSVNGEDLESTIRQLFLNLGYRARDEPTTKRTEWKATYLLSPSYIAEVKYINDITLPSFISEKPLSWINATLLSGKSFTSEINQKTSTILNDHDLRFKISTVQELETDDYLYKSMFPLAIESKAEGPQENTESEKVMEKRSNMGLFTLNSDGNPIPRDEKVNFVRRVNSRIYYDYDGSSSSSSSSSPSHLHVTAILAKVDHFLGDNLQSMISGYDLTLDVNVDRLVKWLEGKIKDHEIMEWLEEVLNHMLEVSEAIMREGEGREKEENK